MAKIHNIILDWSGTITDDFDAVLEATNQIFGEYGKPPFTAEDFKEKFFLPFTEFYKIYLPEATQVQIDNYYHDAFQLLDESISLLPHAQGFLEYCEREKIQLFLLSTIHRKHWEVQGERLGVKKFFKEAYVQAVDKRKVILELLAKHHLDTRQTLFVGDMMHDVDAGAYGGVKTCGVLTGYDSLEKLQRAQPDIIVRDLEGLRAHLEDGDKEIEPHSVPISTVGALIFNEKDEVLMILTYKWNNLWGIPGGKIKIGETALDALHREVSEETSLSLKEVEFQILQDCISPKEFYKEAHFILINYTARTSDTEVKLNHEADEYRWVSCEQALEMEINQPTRILIEKVQKQRSSR